MASSTKNVKLGTCQVFFDGVDLGLTQGGVEFSVTTELHTVEIDQFGKTNINDVIQGRKVMVKAPLAESTIRNLVKIMPGSTLFSNGAQATATVTFATAPAAGNSVTIGGQAFTFQATKPTSVFQVQIGALPADSVTNLANAINLAALRQDLGGISASVNALGTVVTIKVEDPTPLGNAVTLAATGGTASGATLTGGVAETSARVDVNFGVGIDLLSISKRLRLHPSTKLANDYSEDVVLYRAATAGALTFAYKLDTERIYNIEFMAYPEDVTGRLFGVGDVLA